MIRRIYARRSRILFWLVVGVDLVGEQDRLEHVWKKEKKKKVGGGKGEGMEELEKIG